MTSYVQKDRVEEEREKGKKAESASVGLCILFLPLIPKEFSAMFRSKSAFYEGNPSAIIGAAYYRPGPNDLSIAFKARSVCD